MQSSKVAMSDIASLKVEIVALKADIAELKKANADLRDRLCNRMPCCNGMLETAIESLLE